MNIFRTTTLVLTLLVCAHGTASAAPKGDGILVEAESFASKGGWSVDQQFTFEMGSPYLIAHGMGRPVGDASTEVALPAAGRYHVYVRTYNWTSPWSDKSGPGAFRITVGGTELGTTLGTEGSGWMWQYAGAVETATKSTTLTLHDMTGFDGRCDAVWLTRDPSAVPPAGGEALAGFRSRHNPKKIRRAKYDFVVVGGGIAGMCASVAAARQGVKVALINDRPIWGGCNSSETRVHLGGHIEMEPYTNLGNMIKEFGPTRGGNAQPAEFYEDDRKRAFLEAEAGNLDLYPSYRVERVDCRDGHIRAVYATHIETGETVEFRAPVFSDCTGDGTVGYLAGADYAMGRESRAEYGEPSAPAEADDMTMGASVQWYSTEGDVPATFPLFEYGLNFNDQSCERVTMGEWTWETGMNRDQCEEFERIRDYGLMVVYSNWSYLKNRLADNDTYDKRSLGWVAYIAGKRESRRLLGDHVLTENDLVNGVAYPDASFTTTWSIDLHYPDPRNTEHFPGGEFKSICTHGAVNPYAVPYRCLYSRNIDNLFMAGRNISVTHIGLGTVRVMRTTGMMGEVVGMAAGICTRHRSLPRQVYTDHLDELKAMMEKGMGRSGLKNNQLYNLGGNWPTYRKP